MKKFDDETDIFTDNWGVREGVLHQHFFVGVGGPACGEK